jgi:hypothetical protein
MMLLLITPHNVYTHSEDTARRIASFDRCYSFWWSEKGRRWWWRSEKLFTFQGKQLVIVSDSSPWSDLIFSSIYFYILREMGKRWFQRILRLQSDWFTQSENIGHKLLIIAALVNRWSHSSFALKCYVSSLMMHFPIKTPTRNNQRSR